MDTDHTDLKKLAGKISTEMAAIAKKILLEEVVEKKNVALVEYPPQFIMEVVHILMLGDHVSAATSNLEDAIRYLEKISKASIEWMRQDQQIFMKKKPPSH